MSANASLGGRFIERISRQTRSTPLLLMTHNLEIAQVQLPASRKVINAAKAALDVAPPVRTHRRGLTRQESS